MGRGSYSEESPLYLPAVRRHTPFHIKQCPVAPDVLDVGALEGFVLFSSIVRQRSPTLPKK